MTLVERYALLPEQIDRESLTMVQAALPAGLGLNPQEHYILCRIVRAEGDPAIASAVRFSPDAVTQGLAALAGGAATISSRQQFYPTFSFPARRIMTTPVKEPTTAAVAPPAIAPEGAAVPAESPAAAPATAAPAAGLTRLRRKFTVAEYYRMAEEGILHHTERLELLDGEIIVMAAIGVPHAIGVNRLNMAFAAVARDRFIVSVQNPVHLDDYSEPQPDVVIARLRGDAELDSHPGPGDTLLAVEVSDSSLAFDREVKSRRYAAAGIPEMWVMNLPGDCIDRLDLPMPAGYARHTIFRRGETLHPAALPDLELAVDDLLPPRPLMPSTA